MSFLLCAECMCYSVGSVPHACSSPDECQCDQLSGQCPCQPNVVGQNCDRCAADTWNIASGTGCQRCDCDPVHSAGSSCDEVSQTPSPTSVCVISCISVANENLIAQWTVVASFSYTMWGPARTLSKHFSLQTGSKSLWPTRLITEACVCTIFWYMDSSCLGIASLSLCFSAALFYSNLHVFRQKHAHKEQTHTLKLTRKHSGFCVYWLLSTRGRKSPNTLWNKRIHIHSCIKLQRSIVSACERKDILH